MVGTASGAEVSGYALILALPSEYPAPLPNRGSRFAESFPPTPVLLEQVRIDFGRLLLTWTVIAFATGAGLLLARLKKEKQA